MCERIFKRLELERSYIVRQNTSCTGLLLSQQRKILLKKITNLLYSFIWKGKDKIKRAALINTIEKGGFKMPGIESMIKAQRILCIEKFLDTNPAGWKCFFELYHKKVGGKFSLATSISQSNSSSRLLQRMHLNLVFFEQIQPFLTR